MDNENYTFEKWIENRATRLSKDTVTGCGVKEKFLVELVENKDGSYTVRYNMPATIENTPCEVGSIWHSARTLRPWK